MNPVFRLVSKQRRSVYRTLQEFPVTAYASFEKGGQVMCLLEVFGPPEEISRISPCLRHPEDCVYFTGDERSEVCFAKKAEIQSARSRIPKRAGIVQTFFSPDPDNRLIPIFSDRYQEIAFEVSRHLFLPMMPGWSGWVVETLFERDLLRRTDCFGIAACMLVNDREKVGAVLSELIRARRLHPEGPASADPNGWALRPFGERRRDWIRRHFVPRHFTSHPDLTDQAREFLRDRSIEPDAILFQHQTGQGPDAAKKSNRKAVAVLGRLSREGKDCGESFRYVTTHTIAGRTFECVTEGTHWNVTFKPKSGLFVDQTTISIRP